MRFTALLPILLLGTTTLIWPAEAPAPKRSLLKSIKRIYKFAKENPELLELAKDADQLIPRDASGRPIITKTQMVKLAVAAAADVLGDAMKESWDGFRSQIKAGLTGQATTLTTARPTMTRANPITTSVPADPNPNTTPVTTDKTQAPSDSAPPPTALFSSQSLLPLASTPLPATTTLVSSAPPNHHLTTRPAGITASLSTERALPPATGQTASTHHTTNLQPDASCREHSATPADYTDHALPQTRPLIVNAFCRLGQITTELTPTAQQSLTQAQARFTQNLVNINLRQAQQTRCYFTPTPVLPDSSDCRHQHLRSHHQTHAPLSSVPAHTNRTQHSARHQRQTPHQLTTATATTKFHNLTTNEALLLHLWQQQIQHEQAQVPQLNAYFAQARAQHKLFTLTQVRQFQTHAPRPPKLLPPPSRPVYLIGGIGAVVC